ncbi:MAG: hypothetical protein IJ867_01655 [Clostridia bacterium]|nr:hypothetical protein [Clostridia bacterium]
MILYWLINFLITLITFAFGLIPVIETPTWLATNLPQIFTMIFAFNQYLPIYEAFMAVVWLISITMTYKISKIILNRAGIDITKS